MKYSLLALSVLAAINSAHAVSGKIVDTNGNIIPDAKIEVLGQNGVILTDENGEFSISDENVTEIHVQAKGYNHKVLQLASNSKQPITVALNKSIIESIDVIGFPMHDSQLESAKPISVLSDEELQAAQTSTLGETLKYETGVHSNYFGGVASSPIIRGLDGPRVLITQNNLDVSDASRIGPDHVVSAEAITARQIEILRGPATLFYGSGAIGGVVNVVDNRVPQSSEESFALTNELSSVNNETSIATAYSGGTQTTAFHFDGFFRDGDNYDIPGFADADGDDDVSGILENSASESSGFNVGTSMLLENGFVGVSFGRLDRLNGIPGHGHGEEHEGEEHEGEEHEEENIQSELKQNRWQLHSELGGFDGFFSNINTRIGYTSYEHAELHSEENELGGLELEEATRFANDTLQARVNLFHKEVAGWQGAVSFEYKQTDFSALGEEAFTPPSETDEWALALVEEKHIGDFLWQLGARIESVTMNANDIELGHHAHGEEEAGAEGEEELVSFDELEFTPFSLSAGFVWDFTAGYNLGFAITRAERAPNAAELFSAGPHIATRTFEAGALFEVHQEDGETHLDYVGNASKETSTNFDLSLRKFEGDYGFIVNLFYNSIADFYFLNNTGLSSEDLFAEEGIEEPGGEHDHGGDALPVYVFDQADATLYGLELEFAWQLNDNYKWSLWADTVQAELDAGGYLPRTPPARFGNRLNFQNGAYNAEFNVVHYFEQNNIAENETETDAYTMVDARVSYLFPAWNGDASVFLAARNLTDEEARVHSSFLKDQAPLPGRNISLGFRFDY